MPRLERLTISVILMAFSLACSGQHINDNVSEPETRLFFAIVKIDSNWKILEYLEFNGRALVEGDIVIGHHLAVQAQTNALLSSLEPGINSSMLKDPVVRRFVEEKISSPDRRSADRFGPFYTRANYKFHDRSALQPLGFAQAPHGIYPTGHIISLRATFPDKPIWPTKNIYYEIIFQSQPEMVRKVEEAIAIWNNSGTGFHFEKRQHQESPYLTFMYTNGTCESGLGFRPIMDLQGKETVFISMDECCGVANIVHEIGHSVGLYHEHQRLDRDTYITPNIEWLTTIGRKMFTRVFWDASPEGEYDFDSIMHYPQYMPTNSGECRGSRAKILWDQDRPLFELTEEGSDRLRSQRLPTGGDLKITRQRKLSSGDIAALNELYN